MKSRKINKIRMRETLVSYAFLLPAMLIFCAVCAGSHGNGRSYQFFPL